MTNGFQTQVGAQPAPAVEGDFASANPRKTAIAGPGGFVAGTSLFVGRAVWATMSQIDGDGAPALCNSFGSGLPTGILHREQQGLITTFLADASMQVLQGLGVTVMSECDLWVKNNGSTQALRGQKAYANFADGKFTFAATGSPTTDGSCTGSIAASTFSVTGSIAGDVLTVTAVGSGTVVPGATISGTGIASGTKVVSQLSGAAGGIGTYAVSIPEQTVASTTVSGTYGTLTVASALTGAFNVGDVIAGTGGGGVTTGTVITALGTGTGGLGTYIVDPSQTVTSSTITVSAKNVETKWICMTPGLAGELVKITTTTQA